MAQIQYSSDMEAGGHAGTDEELKASRKKSGLDPITGKKPDPFQVALEASRKRLEELKNKKYELPKSQGYEKGKNMVDPSARFERLRGRAKQEQSAQTQAQKEALARRFAALGQTGSGAQIKVEQQAEQAGQKQLGRSFEGIANIEEQEALQREQIEADRAFRAGEAQKGRDFAAVQFENQRQAALESLGLQQDFTAEQAALGRTWQEGQNKLAREQQAEQFKTQFDESISQFSQQMELAQKQFAEEIRINNANLAAQKEALKDPGLIGGLLEDIFGQGTLDFKGTQAPSAGRFGGGLTLPTFGGI